jgi:hypothetical protein
MKNWTDPKSRSRTPSIFLTDKSKLNCIVNSLQAPAFTRYSNYFKKFKR